MRVDFTSPRLARLQRLEAAGVLFPVLLLLLSCFAPLAAAFHSDEAPGNNEECWENYQNLSTPLALTCTVAINDNVLLVGGISTCCPGASDAPAKPVVGVHDVVSMNLMYNANWNLVGELPCALRGAVTCGSFNRNLVVAPAAQDANSLAAVSNELVHIDPDSLSVLRRTPFTIARRRAALACSIEYCFVIGGLDTEGKPVMAIERFDGSAWSTILNLTTPLCDCAVAVHTDEVFLVCSQCDSGGVGVEGIRNIFVSYCLEKNTIMPVMDWPKQYGEGELLSISGASIAQYAVFVAVYKGNIWPVAYYWDLYLEQMHVITTAWLTTPRTSGSAFTAVDSIYYVGGQYFPSANHTSNLLVDNVDYLPVVQPLTVALYGRDNTTYTAGESLDVRCDAGIRIRISDSLRCHSIAPGTNDQNCQGVNTPAYVPVLEPLPVAFLCLARGTCEVDPSRRRPCGSGSDTFRSCNRVMGCCFDSTRNECFHYEIPDGNQTVYFQTGSLTTLTVVPAPTSAPAVPSTTAPLNGPATTPGPATVTAPVAAPPSPLSSFVHSSTGITVFAAVGVVLVVSAAMIIRFGGAPSSHTLSTTLSDGFDVIHGKYTVETKLGQGGFGQVFLVKRKSDGRRYALKYIPCANDEDRNFAIKEFELVRAAQGHKNMITIYDMFMNWSDDHNLYNEVSSQMMHTRATDGHQGLSSPLVDASRRFVCIVMTYCPGGDLAQYIQKCMAEGKRIAETWIMQTLARQMCDVLHHLHNRSVPIVHRDLKPENVLISTDRSETMLTDFGLASQQEKTYMSTRAGSLHYVAPECWKKHYSATVDLWAVGCILYATATGRVTVSTARVMFNDAKEKGFQRDIRHELSGLGYTEEFASFVLAFLQVDHRKRLTAVAAIRWLDDIAAGIPRNEKSYASPTRALRTPNQSDRVSSDSVDAKGIQVRTASGIDIDSPINVAATAVPSPCTTDPRDDERTA